LTLATVTLPATITSSFVDTTASEGNYAGFALDSIHINDWVMV
jgi:hypothetical protein